jgi:hypothetical protein
MNNDNKYYTILNEKVNPTPLYQQKIIELNRIFSRAYLIPYKIEIDEELRKIIEDTRKIIMEDFIKIIEKILLFKNQGYMNNLKDNKINTLVTNLKSIINEMKESRAITDSMQREIDDAEESGQYYAMMQAMAKSNSAIAIKENIISLSKFFLDVLAETGINVNKSYTETGGRGKKRKYSTKKKSKKSTKKKSKKSKRRAFSKKA